MSAPNTTVLGAIGAVAMVVLYKKVLCPIIVKGSDVLGDGIRDDIKSSKERNARSQSFLTLHTVNK